MKKHLSTRLLSVLLIVALLAGYAVPVQAVTDHSHAAAESESLAFTELENSTSLELLNEETVTEEAPLYADTDIVRVSIVLDKESTIESGFSTENIAANTEAMAYRGSLEAEQEVMTAGIEAAIGEELDVVWNLTLVANVISANVEYGQIADIEAVDGVKEVVLETRYEPAVMDQEEALDPNMATSGSQIGSTLAWANGYTGAGSRIAIIDTGVDTDHQSFSVEGFQYSLAYQAGFAGEDLDEYMESLDLLDTEEIASVLDQLHVGDSFTAEDLYVNSKIAFGYNYIDEDVDITHDNDSQGSHGSHVSGIATANAYIPNGDGSFSNALDTVFVQGVAPDAQLITMKVFGKGGGAYDTDYMVAIEDAIILGCDAVNLSLGSAAHGLVTNSGYQELLDSLTSSGTVTVMSAGNNGYWTSNTQSPAGLPYADDINFFTGGSPGSYVNSLAVASVQNAGQTGYYVQVGDSRIYYNGYSKAEWTNEPMTTIAGEREYIFIDGIGSEADWAAVGDALVGKIAICSRGTTSFFQKGIAAVEAGAIATIIYNNTSGTINMDLSSYTKTEPCVSITQAEGALIRSLSTPVTDEEGNVLYYTGKMYVGETLGTVIDAGEYYTMSSFSSWGVPTALILKPEITAPGGNIYSINGVDTSGTAYENNSGTSMSAPQVTGMTAVVAQYIRENGLEEKTGLSVRQLAQSLLMSTSVPMMEEANDGYYYSVLNQGSGLANVGAAVTANSYITMNADATASWADGKVKAELGDDPARKGEYTFSFNLNNISDSEKTYTLSSDFFTQAIAESEGISYLDTWTTPIAARVTYLVDGEEFVPVSKAECDLDNDGDTDADDAQIILNYAVGLVTEIDAIADVNGDSSVNTYDAYLVLASMRTDEIAVGAGEDVTVTVKITLSDTVKAALDAAYVNGAYLEGYVYVEPTATTEGVVGDVTHSIPVLGFYGSWTDSSMYEKNTYAERQYGDTTPTYFNPGNKYSGITDSNSLTIKYAGDTASYYLTGNPYITEETYPADRIAVSGSTTLSSYKVTLLRNAAALATFVTNEAGEVVFVSKPTLNVNGAFYYTSGATWRNTLTSSSISRSVDKLGVSEGETITIGVVAIPEYYAMDGALTEDAIAELIETDTLGDGAYLTTRAVVDNTAPEVTSLSKSLIDGSISVTASDDNYIAAVMVTNASGATVYASGLPEQTEKNQEVTMTLDIADSGVGSKYVVTVADYAGNKTSYEVYDPSAAKDYSGQMFVWTRNGARRTQEEIAAGCRSTRWMMVDPETLWYNTADGSYTGTTNFTSTTYGGSWQDYVLCGDYVEGYVIFACMDGYIYSAPLEDLDSRIQLASWADVVSGSSINNMRLNYADGYMYLLDNQENFYKFDLGTLELTYAFSISLYNPVYPSSAAYNKLMDFAIHKDGTFYLLSTACVNAQFLYTFTMDQIQEYANDDGTTYVGIQNLEPINNSKSGKTGLSGMWVPYQMFWDHDNEILYMIGNSNKNGTCNAKSRLYVLNLEDGSVSLANDYIPEGAEGGSSACFYNYVHCAFIIPKGDTILLPDDIATEVSISAPRTEVLVNASMQFSSEVGPWNLADKSVTWSSSDETIATVNAKGVATFHAAGNVTITATTVAEPHLQASYDVSVVPYPATQLTASVTGADGETHIAEFSTDDLSTVTSISDAMPNFLAGGLHEGKLYFHDGQQMYAVDAENQALTNLGVLASSWQWSGAASAPQYGLDLFNILVGVSDGGKYLELIVPESGSLRYFDLSSNEIFSGDPIVTLCYAGPYAKYPGYEYYVIRESGRISQLFIYTETEGYNFGASISTDAATYSTGIDLSGASTIGSGNYGSCFYDEATGYVLATQSLGGEQTNLYAIDPSNGITALIGTFSEDIERVSGLYMWDRATDTTVRLDEEVLDLYMDETYDLNPVILPAGTSENVTYSSSDETIVTVDADGVITPVAVGTATVTVTTEALTAEGVPATDSVTVNVTDVTGISTKVYAQVTDENGSTYWAEIDTGSLSATKIDDASVAITGGGYHDGMIYGTDSDYVNGGSMYEIDIDNGYSATAGAIYSSSYATLDGASAPLLRTDGTTSSPKTSNKLYDTCDFLVTLTKSGVVTLMSDYTSSSLTGFNFVSRMRGAGAIAVTGKVLYSKYYGYEYYILENDGDLHKVIIYPKVISGSVNYSSAFTKALTNIGEILPDNTKMTMTYVDDGTNLGLLLGYSGTENAELYFLDMSGEEIVTHKIGTLDGITDLTSMYLPIESSDVEEPVDPAGQMLVWTGCGTYRVTEEEKTNGQWTRWMVVDEETLWYNTSSKAYSGTEIYAATQYTSNVLAAEYVNGSVIFAGDDGYLYSAPITDPANATQLLYWKDVMASVNDMALNVQNGYLYLLENGGKFYRYDVTANTLTLDYSVTCTYPTGSNAAYLYPYSFTIDDSGNFYAVNFASAANSQFLYTWTLNDVAETTAEDGTVTRAITGLAPIASESTGISGASRVCFLAWDHDADVLYMMGTGTNNSAKANSTNTKNILYVLDTTTGKASAANSYVPEDQTGGTSALMYVDTKGMFIVPTSASQEIDYAALYEDVPVAETDGEEIEAVAIDIAAETEGFVPGTVTTLTSVVELSTDVCELSTEAVNQVGGSTNSLSGIIETVKRAVVSINAAESAVTETGVELKLTETTEVTNGKFVVTYDPVQLTYTGITSTVGSTAVHVDEANGTVTFAYAAGSGIAAGETIATVSFSYAKDYVDTTVTTATIERNDEILTDAVVTTEVTYEVGGHSYEVTDSKDVTCTEDGYKVYTCSKCGDSYTEELKAEGHKYEAVVTEPGCTEMGYTTHTCSGCGDSYKTDYVNPTGHIFGEWESVTEPGCDTEGLQKRTCKCGEVEYRDTDATGHSYETVVIEPTCTQMGYTTYTCSVCGHSYNSDYVNPTGHSFEAVVTEPTCTGYGYTTYTCHCGESYVSDFVEAWCPAESYTDLNVGAWYHEGVCYVLRNGLMKGKAAGVFAPDANLSRAELVTVLYRMAGEPSVEGLENPFTDVPAGTWYTDAVIWAYSEGIVNGISASVFAPGNDITRQQIATILYRYAGAEPVAEDHLSAFTDAAAVSSYAVDGMNWAVAKGLINGVTADTLAPASTATRAQIATILMRLSQQ